MADTISIKLGERTFILDREKAEDAYSAKKVINGRNSMFFNILPLYSFATAGRTAGGQGTHERFSDCSLQGRAAAFRDASQSTLQCCWPSFELQSQLIWKHNQLFTPILEYFEANQTCHSVDSTPWKR